MNGRPHLSRADFVIERDDLRSAEVADLLAAHLAEMHACSPASKAHAMPVERLRQPDVTFYTARHDGRLAAVGALREIDAQTGELKSMRAAPDYRGTGAGAALLEHLLTEARARGYRRVGLETGRTELFRPAQRLYRRYGFAECETFSTYRSDDFSMCMELPLA